MIVRIEYWPIFFNRNGVSGTYIVKDVILQLIRLIVNNIVYRSFTKYTANI